MTDEALEDVPTQPITEPPYPEEEPQARARWTGNTSWDSALPWLSEHPSRWFRIGYYANMSSALGSAGQALDQRRFDPAGFKFACAHAPGGGVYLFGAYEPPNK